jgi:hypothetical protein
MSSPRAFIPPLEHPPALFGTDVVQSLPSDYLPGLAASPSSIEWDEHDVVGQNESPFTGQTQSYDWRSAWWEAQVSFPPMNRYSHDAWSAFLSRLRGPLNAFLIGDPKARIPKGCALGTPVVNGSNQSGYSFATRGWKASTKSVLMFGDFIQIGYRLYKLTDTVDSDASGNATLPIWPPLREQPPEGSGIITRNCKGLFRLKAANGNKHSTNVGNYGFSGFAIREALDTAGSTGITAGWAPGSSLGSSGSGTITPPPTGLTMVTSWWNETGTSLGSVLAQGLVAEVSFAGAAPVAVPPLSFAQSFSPTGATSAYAFFALSSALTWQTYWGGTLASGSIPDRSLVAARLAAGDLVFLAEWGFAPVGPSLILTYVGGGVSIYT